jgi:hypothetical protein
MLEPAFQGGRVTVIISGALEGGGRFIEIGEQTEKEKNRNAKYVSWCDYIAPACIQGEKKKRWL